LREAAQGNPALSRKVTAMRNRLIGPLANPPATLADVLTGLERNKRLSPKRRRELRYGVSRAARLLRNEPRAILLHLSAIGARLADINPVAVGISAKRVANVRSILLPAVQESGVRPAKAAASKALSPAWIALLKRRSGRRAQIGLSRLARYASSRCIEPNEVNDEVIAGFIAGVRDSSLHPNPNALHRQTTLITRRHRHQPASISASCRAGAARRAAWWLRD